MTVVGRAKRMSPIVYWAQTYLQQMKHSWPNEKLAVTFDIDDTVLSGNPQQAIGDMLKLYTLAVQLGYNVYFVTARPFVDRNYDSTVEQLHQAGFSLFHGLFLMPESYLDSPNFSHFKYAIRKQLHDSGQNIVLNMGDTWHDLMLLPPFQNDPQIVPKVKSLLKLSNREFVIFRPPDIAWMAIKMPYALD
jgi:predicted secreted acid phosphatase